MITAQGRRWVRHDRRPGWGDLYRVSLGGVPLIGDLAADSLSNGLCYIPEAIR
jgi:hypothetical protein